MSHPSLENGPDWGQFLFDVRAGQRDFADFFDRAYPAIYRFFRSRDLHDRDAEDLASEVMTRIYMRIATLTAASPAQAAAWVYSIARNLWIDHYRRPSLGVTEGVEDLAIPDPHHDEHGCENVEYVLHLLSKLSDEDRELIEMRFIDGMKFEEIAAIKQATVNAVAGRINRALRKLREYGRQDNQK